MKALGVARHFGTTIDIFQPMYSLVKRQVEVKLLPMKISENINVAYYSPLGSGLLTGKYINGGVGRLGPVDNHLEAISAATRFQHAA